MKSLHGKPAVSGYGATYATGHARIFGPTPPRPTCNRCADPAACAAGCVRVVSERRCLVCDEPIADVAVAVDGGWVCFDNAASCDMKWDFAENIERDCVDSPNPYRPTGTPCE